MQTPVYTKLCGLPTKPYPVIHNKLLPQGKDYAMDPAKRNKSLPESSYNADPAKRPMTTQRVTAAEVGGLSMDALINAEAAIDRRVNNRNITEETSRLQQDPHKIIEQQSLMSRETSITNVGHILSRNEMREAILNGWSNQRVTQRVNYKEITIYNHQQTLSSVEDWKIANNVDMALSPAEIFKLRENQNLKDCAQGLIDIDAYMKEKELEECNKRMREEERIKREAYERSPQYLQQQRKVDELTSRMKTKYPELFWKNHLRKKKLSALKTIRTIWALHCLKKKHNTLQVKVLTIMSSPTKVREHLINVARENTFKRVDAVAMELIKGVNAMEVDRSNTNAVNEEIEIEEGMLVLAPHEIQGRGIEPVANYVGGEKDIVAASMDLGSDEEGVVTEEQAEYTASSIASITEKIEIKTAEMLKTIANNNGMENTDMGGSDNVASAEVVENGNNMMLDRLYDFSNNNRDVANRDADIATMDNKQTKVWSDIETSAKNVGRENDRALDRIYGLSNDNSRKNLTCNGLTYNCSKCHIGKIPGEVTKYYSCAMVYHTDDGTWKQKRQTKDKIDSDKAKCGGTLKVQYTQCDGFIVTANTKHKCNGK